MGNDGKKIVIVNMINFDKLYEKESCDIKLFYRFIFYYNFIFIMLVIIVSFWVINCFILVLIFKL